MSLSNTYLDLLGVVKLQLAK